jgi:hypothetical protein
MVVQVLEIVQRKEKRNWKKTWLCEREIGSNLFQMILVVELPNTNNRTN